MPNRNWVFQKIVKKDWPNPVQQIVHVEGVQIQEISVFDLSGRNILHQQTSPENTYHEVGISPLLPGLYLLRVKGDNSAKTRIQVR